MKGIRPPEYPVGESAPDSAPPSDRENLATVDLLRATHRRFTLVRRQAMPLRLARW